MTLERYRKWVHDNVNMPSYRIWWPDACRWVARQCAKSPENPPEKIKLVRIFTGINPLGSATVHGAVHRINFFTYNLTDEDIHELF